MARRFPSIPQPHPTLESLLATVAALKESVELLTRQRGPKNHGVVTWQDLLDLNIGDLGGFILPDQVPPPK